MIMKIKKIIIGVLWFEWLIIITIYYYNTQNALYNIEFNIPTTANTPPIIANN